MVSEIIVNQLLQSLSTPLMDLFFQIVTFFGHPLPWIVIAAWLFWVGKEKKSFIVISIVLISTFFSGALKTIIARPRPTGLMVLEKPLSFSMPSGHSVLAGTIYSFYEKKVKKKEKYLLALLVVLTAISRLYLGVHFISDVLVGLLIGYILGKAICKLEKRINKAELKVTKIKEEKALFALFILMVVAIFILPETFYLGFTLFGYYFGFVIYRDLKMKICAKNNYLNLFFGTILLGIITLIAYKLSGIESIILFFIAGLYITILWPLIVTKLKI